MDVDKNINPDRFPEDDTYELERNNEDFEIAPWKDKRDKKEHIPTKGKSTLLHTEGKREEEEVSAFRSGVGDNDDLMVKLPESEEVELPFQYASRYRGRKKHETEIYPEIPFEYGIHYEGEKFTLYNEQPYDHRVDAYPGKTMKYSVTQRDPQPTKRNWEAQLDVHARVRQDILQYAVQWKGKYAEESVTGAADLFTSARGHFIGPGNPTGIWHKHGNSVREIDNRSHGSGVIAKEFYDWTDYEVEYEFKTLKATGIRDDPLAKVVHNGRLYSVPGADDDIIGFIFRAQKNNRDFYCFLWEGDNNIVTGTRNRTLNGYPLLTGGISGRYSHAAAEKVFEKYGVITNMSDIGINPATYRSGMRLTSSQLNRYRNHMSRVGWGNQHYRLYRVRDGIMREVNVNYRGNGRGWRQDWFKLDWKNSVKIRCTGRNVKIYTQSYRQGNYNANNYQLAVEFTLPRGYEKGSVGLLTFSQAVQFDKIRVTRWNDMSGRVPSSGWYEYKNPGERQLSSSGRSYVNSSARNRARQLSKESNPDYEITSVTGIVNNPKVGSISASLNGPVKVRTNNPKDAGQIRVIPIIKKGTATITPDHISPGTAKVIFDDVNTVFGRDIDKVMKDPDLEKLETTKLKINVPSNPLDDWDLEGERFTMWNRNPEVIVTTKHFTDKVYAYQGWVEVLNCREVFDGLKWATYHLDVVDETINDDYDEIELVNERVYMRTTEWYRGIYPADIKNDGIVTNEEPVYVDIPPMPEHYVEPNTGEVMYHGYEDVDFLLIQLKPSHTREVWMGFRSNFEKSNTRITKEPINVINGRPIIKTHRINDQVEIRCEDKPRFIPWISGKYIGYGKVNGRRPFFKDGLGKADMIDVPTDVVFLPLDPEMATIDGPEDYEKAKEGYVYNLSPPIVDISDDRVQFEYTNDGKTLRFYSDYMDSYIWYTDWYGDWHTCDKTYTVKSGEVLTIEDPIDLDVRKDPTYDAADTIIDKFEVISTNPFVDLWAKETGGKETGWHGLYYQYPLRYEVVEEAFQADGDYHEMIQRYTIKAYMTEVSVDIQGEKVSILSVTRDGDIIPENSQNGWTFKDNQVLLHGNAIQSGELEIHYAVGFIETRYTLQKNHEKHITVYHKGKKLDEKHYKINGQQIEFIDLDLKKYDWLHVQSYEGYTTFNPQNKNYLGKLVGTRMDPEIWFDWGEGDPIDEFTPSISSALNIKSLSIQTMLSDTINFRYNLDMEVVYPVHEPIDISNFTGEWEQFDTIPVEEGGLNGPGDWHGPPEPGYTEVTNLRNQNGISGWFNPNHAELTDYTFQFTVQVRGGDDDMYGAMFKFDPDTLNFYSFEWDAYHSIGSGGTGVRGMAIYKNICRNPENKGIGRLQYTRTQLAHLPISWTAHANEINHIRISTIGNNIKVWINETLRFDIIDSDDPFTKGAWGPITQSQPNTYFWDFSMETFERVTPKEYPNFRQAMSYVIERPIINEEPLIDVRVDGRIAPIMETVLNNFLAEYGLEHSDLMAIEYFLRDDRSPYPVFFHHQSENLGVQTNNGDAEVYAVVLGKEPPQLPPEEKEIPDQPKPLIPKPEFPAMMSDSFAISWSGYIHAPETGYYRFHIEVDDAIRLWVNNQLLIDEWETTNGERFEESIYLEGGKWYPIKVNYADVENKAHVRFRWKRPSRGFERIPKDYIAPYLGYIIKARVKDETPMPWSPLVHNGYYYYQHYEHYLYADKIKKKIELDANGQMTLHPRPKQGSPIIIDHPKGIYFRKVSFMDENHKLTLRNKEVFHGNQNSKYYLKYKDINKDTLRVYVNGVEVTDYQWNENESSITFHQVLTDDDLIEISYILQHSFYVDINYDVEDDTALVQFTDIDKLENAYIVYEGHATSPFYRAKHVLTNPILNHNHRGFLYMTKQTDREAKEVHIHVSPKHVGINESKEITVTGQVFDRHSNPISEKEVEIYRDDTLLKKVKTNEAGEVYVKDTPPANDELMTTYRIVCGEIENTASLNFYRDDIPERCYIELKAGKSSVIAGADDEVAIYATLRSPTWHVIPDAHLVFEWIDSKKKRHRKQVRTDANGQAEIILSGKDEVHGVIYVTASYNMGREHAKSSLYIRSIGG